MTTVGVVGTGSWGTALAEVQAQIGHRVLVWDVDHAVLETILKTGENHGYHPGIHLSKNVRVEFDLAKLISASDVIILAIPSHSIRDHLPKIWKLLTPPALVVSAAKGIEVGTLKTASAVAAELVGEKEVSRRFATLSGPSFAHEVIRGTPTYVTVAASDLKVAKRVQDLCHSDNFRLLTSADVIGVELAGALKNVIAIAAGAVDGLGFGLNARAALITRGLAEMVRIGVKKGADPITFSGLAGLGDLILTCTDDLSRNRRVGLKLAQGKSLRVVMREVGQVAEGIRTAKAAHQLSRKLGVETPILEAIYLTLYERRPPLQAIKDILSRAPEHEPH